MTRAKNVVFVFKDDPVPTKAEIEERALHKGREMTVCYVQSHDDLVTILADPAMGTPAGIFVTDSAPVITRIYLGDEGAIEIPAGDCHDTHW